MKKLISAVLINTVIATSVAYAGIDVVKKKQQADNLECLALNIYFETSARSLADSMAVTDVVLNRVESTRYPDNACDVVHQGYKKGSRYCQFSWYCDGKSDEVKDKESYKKILDFARLMMHNDIKFVDITDGATHYHADYVSPSWAKTKTRTTEIGDHIFYRWEKK